MSELSASPFEIQARPNVEVLEIDLGLKEHTDIQKALTDLCADLQQDSDPTISNDRVRFVPISRLSAVEGDNIKGVPTIIDIIVSSQRPYWEGNDQSTYGLITELISGSSVPLEEISTVLVHKDTKASDVDLISKNQLAGLESSITFAQLSKSLAKLTGIPSLAEYGDPDKHYLFNEALKFMFEDLVSGENRNKIAIDEVSHEKIYENEDFVLETVLDSPVQYETKRVVKLDVKDYLKQGVRSLELSSMGVLSYFEEGTIDQTFSYQFFVGSRNKPAVTMTLSSEDFTHEQLKEKIRKANLDARHVTNSAINLLNQH